MRRLNVSGLLAGPLARQENDRVYRMQSRIQDMGELMNQVNLVHSNSGSRGPGATSRDSKNLSRQISRTKSKRDMDAKNARVLGDFDASPFSLKNTMQQHSLRGGQIFNEAGLNMQLQPSFGGQMYNPSSIRSLHMLQAASLRDQNITAQQADQAGPHGYSQAGKASLQSLLPAFPQGHSNMDSIIHTMQANNQQPHVNELQGQNSLFGNQSRLFESQLSFNKRMQGSPFLAAPPQIQRVGPQASAASNMPSAGRPALNFGMHGAFYRPKQGGDDPRRISSGTGGSFLQQPGYRMPGGQTTASTNQGQSNPSGGDFLQNFFNPRNASFLQAPQNAPANKQGPKGSAGGSG